MPQKQPKPNQKRNQPKKSQPKTQPPKTVSITSSKLYWATLTAFMVVFGALYGYQMKISILGIGMLIASVIAIIGLAYYVKFHPSTIDNRSRVAFVLLGALLVGFAVWAGIVLILGALGAWSSLVGPVGVYFFAITSLIMCMTLGAVMGDLVGKKKETLSAFFRQKFKRIFLL